MAGYQVHQPSFFVNLQQSEPLSIAVKQLQQTVMKPAVVSIDNPGNDTTPIADGEQVLGTYVTFSSTGAVQLPSNVEMYNALKAFNNETLGNQLSNALLVPREALITPKVGASFFTTFYNPFNSVLALTSGYQTSTIYLPETAVSVIHSTLVIDDPENPVFCACKLDGYPLL